MWKDAVNGYRDADSFPRATTQPSELAEEPLVDYGRRPWPCPAHSDMSDAVDAPDGAVVARLSADGAEFWVADESPEHKNFSPETLAGGSIRMVMIVDDPDSAFAKAIGAGATVVWPGGNLHGWRVGRVVVPFGHHWEIGEPVS